VVGTHVLTAGTYANVLDALSDYHLTDFDAQMRTLRARKRPREVAMVRTALGIATDATIAAERAFANGATTTQAMVEAERAARVNRARDVRLLANIGGDDLRPFEGLADARRTPLLLWVGLTYGGYWADVAITSPAPTDNDAARAVAAMTAAAKAGARSRDVAQAALDVLSPAAAETALAYGLGGGIGLALNDWPPISPTSAEPLPDGALLSLRTLARDGDRVSFAGAIVQVRPEGGRRLEPL
jgi:Xaa-Pro aminopeptidase